MTLGTDPQMDMRTFVRDHTAKSFSELGKDDLSTFKNILSAEAAKVGLKYDDPELLGKVASTVGLPPLPPKGGADINAIMKEVYELARKGNTLVIYRTASGTVKTTTKVEPQNKQPKIVLVETYALTSFLGDYGASRTVRTFTLLPNERTKISVKTWKSQVTTAKQASSILDSWTSDTSDSFETTAQSENTDKETQADAFQWNVQAEAEATWGWGKAKVSGGLGGSSNSTRERFGKNVSTAASKHVANASAKRNVEVNTTSEQKVETGEEQSIVRELENVNAGRVLNFVFRQLNQEYITYLHLIDVKLAFADGIGGSPIHYKEFYLAQLEDFLSSYIRDPYQDAAGNQVNPRDRVREVVVEQLKNIYDYTGRQIEFIECIDVTTGQSVPVNNYLTNQRLDANGFQRLYLRVKKSRFYQNTNSNPQNNELPFEKHIVEGIITEKNTFILPTDSVIVEALLGQTEALDKYSIESRKAVIDMKREEIKKMSLANAIIQNEESDKAELFGKVYPPSVKLVKATETEAQPSG